MPQDFNNFLIFFQFSLHSLIVILGYAIILLSTHTYNYTIDMTLQKCPGYRDPLFSYFLSTVS